MKSAIAAIAQVFLSKKQVSEYTNFQLNGNGVSIGKHKFSNSNDWSEYEAGDIGIINYKTEEQISQMSMQKIEVTKNFKAIDWFRSQFGYSEGAVAVLQDWNPEVNFNKLRIGQELNVLR